MSKLTVAAALIAALAVAAPAHAETVPVKQPQASILAPKAKANVRPERKPLLDGMSTQSIKPVDKSAGERGAKTPVAATGIAVNPSFFSF